MNWRVYSGPREMLLDGHEVVRLVARAIEDGTYWYRLDDGRVVEGSRLSLVCASPIGEA